MNPDISEIIKVSLDIVDYIMFYVPRTLMLIELFGILAEITKKNRLFFDIHILKSANKIKALLIIFGYDINKTIIENDIEEYLKIKYKKWNLNDIHIKMISAIAKTIGNYRFFENEINFRKNFNLNDEDDDDDEDDEDINFNIGKELFKYFFDNILTNEEKIKLKSLKIYSQYKNLNNTYNKNKNIIMHKKNNNKINIININHTNNNKNSKYISENNNNNNNFLDKNTVEYTGDNNKIYILMKEEIIKEKEKEKLEEKNEKMMIQKNKNLKLSPKNFNYKHFLYTDKDIKTENEKNQKKIQTSPTNTVSTSPSSIAETKKKTNPLISEKNNKNRDRILTSCHEINLSFINKK